MPSHSRQLEIACRSLVAKAQSEYFRRRSISLKAVPVAVVHARPALATGR